MLFSCLVVLRFLIGCVAAVVVCGCTVGSHSCVGCVGGIVLIFWTMWLDVSFLSTIVTGCLLLPTVVFSVAIVAVFFPFWAKVTLFELLLSIFLLFFGIS